MTSPAFADIASRLYSHEWSATMSGTGTLTFVHAGPAQIESLLDIFVEHEEAEAKTQGSEFEVAGVREQVRTTKLKAYAESRTTFQVLDVLLLARDDTDAKDDSNDSNNDTKKNTSKVMGYGNLYKLPSGALNVGLIMFNQAKGRGLGTIFTRFLFQLGFELGQPEMEAGTMKANVAMRRVMSHLGIAEVDRIYEVEGRGVLAEVMYFVQRDEWRSVCQIQLDLGDELSFLRVE